MKVPALGSVVWAIARLPDPIKATFAAPGSAAGAAAVADSAPSSSSRGVASAAAAMEAGGGAVAKRMGQAVAALGAFLITKRLRCGELMNTLVGLALSGYVPPREFDENLEEGESWEDAAAREEGRGKKGAQAAGGGRRISFGTWLEERTAGHLHRLELQGVGDTAFVLTRLVTPGSVSKEWLAEYEEVGGGGWFNWRGCV